MQDRYGSTRSGLVLLGELCKVQKKIYKLRTHNTAQHC